MQETEYSVPSERLAGNICPSRAYAGSRLCRGPDLKTTGKAGECLYKAFTSSRARRGRRQRPSENGQAFVRAAGRSFAGCGARAVSRINFAVSLSLIKHAHAMPFILCGLTRVLCFGLPGPRKTDARTFHGLPPVCRRRQTGLAQIFCAAYMVYLSRPRPLHIPPAKSCPAFWLRLQSRTR